MSCLNLTTKAARQQNCSLSSHRRSHAGLNPWPRLLQNLRSSCETEWCERYPIASVTRRLGNSPTVALKHYIQARDVHFEAVVAGSERRDAKDDARDA